MCNSLMHPIKAEINLEDFAWIHGTDKQYMYVASCEIAQLWQTTEILQQCWEIVILIAWVTSYITQKPVGSFFKTLLYAVVHLMYLYTLIAGCMKYGLLVTSNL